VIMGFGLDDCVALQGRFKGGALQGKAKRSSSSSADAERQEEWFASLQERRAETIEKLAIKKAKRDQKELVRTLHFHLHSAVAPALHLQSARLPSAGSARCEIS